MYKLLYVICSANINKAFILCFCILQFSCKKSEIAIVPPQHVEPSKGKFSLKAFDGSCLNASVVGTSYSGLALTNSNYILLKGKATEGGPYDISTDTVNGIYFTSKGTLTRDKEHTFLLRGHGVPQKSGFVALSLQSSDASICQLDFYVEESVDSLRYGWQFYDNGIFRKGVIDSSDYETHETGDAFHIQGRDIANTDGVFAIGLYTGIGKFSETEGENRYITGFYRQKKSYVFDNWVDYSLTVDSFDPVTRIIEGRFSGKAISMDDVVEHIITDGRFRARLEHITINPRPDF